MEILHISDITNEAEKDLFFKITREKLISVLLASVVALRPISRLVR